MAWYGIIEHGHTLSAYILASGFKFGVKVPVFLCSYDCWLRDWPPHIWRLGTGSVEPGEFSANPSKLLFCDLVSRSQSKTTDGGRSLVK